MVLLRVALGRLALLRISLRGISLWRSLLRRVSLGMAEHTRVEKRNVSYGSSLPHTKKARWESDLIRWSRLWYRYQDTDNARINSCPSSTVGPAWHTASPPAGSACLHARQDKPQTTRRRIRHYNLEVLSY
ncbi:hypothetical protein B0T24DRAFT_588846 [Lasiosphaeria ovina]|uniref:Uncharacterized protein n=1 Tax=Lasiosphaeria ovina TaxID=92902 RepID=A0AAE0NMG8_9PEZI|nr:hypothetical protein B0T24DRAFT_588846 [Lasiosphaeria ovina]